MKVKVVGIRNDVKYDFHDGKLLTGRQIYYIKSVRGVDGFVCPSKPLFLNDTHYKDFNVSPNDNLIVSFNESGKLESVELE